MSVALFSQNGKDKISAARKVSYMKSADKQQLKAVYMYDSSEKCISRNLYIENGQNEWVPIHKYEYTYNNNGLVGNVVFTKWDERKGNWEKNALVLVHDYDLSGKMLSQKEMIMTNNNLISSK